jgi:hypothetical protein
VTQPLRSVAAAVGDAPLNAAVNTVDSVILTPAARALDAVQANPALKAAIPAGAALAVDAANGSRDAFKAAKSVIDKAPVMLGNTMYTVAGQPLDGAKASSNREAVFAKPMSKDEFLASLKTRGVDLANRPELSKLLDQLGSEKGYLEKEGYRCLDQLAGKADAKKLAAMSTTLSNYLSNGKRTPDYRHKLASDGLRDVAFPTTIEQGAKPNCGAIAAQQFWANEKPDTYLSALTDLADDKAFPFPNGYRLQPLNDARVDPKDGRPDSVKVMSDALGRHAHLRDPYRQAAISAGKLGWTAFAGHRPSVLPGIDNYHPTMQPQGVHTPQEIASLLGDITGNNYSAKMGDALRRAERGNQQGSFVPTLVSGDATKEWHWVGITGKQGSSYSVSSWGSQFPSTAQELDPYVRCVITSD